jgi:hypothetical protein
MRAWFGPLPTQPNKPSVGFKRLMSGLGSLESLAME